MIAHNFVALKVYVFDALLRITYLRRAFLGQVAALHVSGSVDGEGLLSERLAAAAVAVAA